MTHDEIIKEMKEKLSSDNLDILEKKLTIHRTMCDRIDKLRDAQQKLIDTFPECNQWNHLKTIFPELADAIQGVTCNFWLIK